jgi:Spy/CpxP family protein refolding chaperone
MRTLFLVAALASTLGISAQQQQPTTAAKPVPSQVSPDQKAEKLTAEMAQQLQLTEEQTTQVGQINKDHVNAMAQLKQAGLDEQAMEARASVLRNKYDARLKSVLTAEQYTAFVAARKEKRDAAATKQQQMSTKTTVK